MVNGGYFYNGNHTGIAVINSIKSGSVSAVRGSLKTGDTEYNSMYNVTRGTFGVDASGKPNVVWTGTDASSNVFYFDRPLPSVKGENKYGIVTNENPTAAISWSPKYALSAGPVLLKDKKSHSILQRHQRAQITISVTMKSFRMTFSERM